MKDKTYCEHMVDVIRNRDDNALREANVLTDGMWNAFHLLRMRCDEILEFITATHFYSCCGEHYEGKNKKVKALMQFYYPVSDLFFSILEGTTVDEIKRVINEQEITNEETEVH